MIGRVWFALLVMPIIVVAAFVLFCFALVAALVGYVDPASSPRVELSKLLGYVGRVERWVREPRW